MTIKLRKEIKLRPKRIVVKLGSLAVTKDSGGVDKRRISKIVEDISFLKNSGIEIVLVSSGAINAARNMQVSFKDGNTGEGTSTLQSLSAIGQPYLFSIFSNAFQRKGFTVGQALLTHEDFKKRKRSLNIKNTINTLLANNVMPILNENDTVSFEEISLGDNDQLAAMIAELVEADLLLMLTTTDGVYNSPPGTKNSKLLKIVEYGDSLKEVKLNSGSSVGRGGMKTKLWAVNKCTPLGISVIISSFKKKSPISRALTESIGTFFRSKHIEKNMKKGWLLTTVKANSVVKIDDGAFKALCKGSSLLAAGIIASDGTFQRGDCIGIKHKSKIIAVGISEFSSKDVKLIHGLKNSEIKKVLGEKSPKVVLHRNNLFLKESK
jgi:glutamate 5-kinase